MAFEVTPPANQDQATIEPVATIDGKEYNLKVQHIDYKHIPLQTLSLSAKAKVVRLNIEKKGNYIGYIEGAGDVADGFGVKTRARSVTLLDQASGDKALTSEMGTTFVR